MIHRAIFALIWNDLPATGPDFWPRHTRRVPLAFSLRSHSAQNSPASRHGLFRLSRHQLARALTRSFCKMFKAGSAGLRR